MLRPRRDDRGSAVLLVPALVLIGIVLSAIAVDSAIALQAERDLSALVAAAANDAAGAALADAAFYEEGRIRIDPAAARRAAAAAVAARTPHPVDGLDVRVEVGATTVRVTATGTVDRLFAAAIPGAGRPARVDAEATARLLPGTDR